MFHFLKLNGSGVVVGMEIKIKLGDYMLIAGSSLFWIT
jgi:hypothetical protein